MREFQWCLMSLFPIYCQILWHHLQEETCLTTRNYWTEVWKQVWQLRGDGVNISANQFDQVLLFQLQPQLLSGAPLTLRTAAVQTVSLQRRSKLVSTHFWNIIRRKHKPSTFNSETNLFLQSAGLYLPEGSQHTEPFNESANQTAYNQEGVISKFKYINEHSVVQVKSKRIYQFLCLPESALFYPDEFLDTMKDRNAENATEAPVTSITGGSKIKSNIKKCFCLPLM